MKTINVRVSDEDHAMFHRLADAEYMPISVLVRRTLMQLAEQRGMLAEPESDQPTKPEIVRVIIPTGPNAWRDEIVRRVDAGEKLQDVANSYGVSADVIRPMYKRGKENEEALSKDVWNDPAKLGAINDAKFQALMRGRPT